MNELNVAAQGTANAWCKGDLRAEAESKAQGDTYCAIGHIAKALAESKGLTLSLNGEYMGTPEQLAPLDAYLLSRRSEGSRDLKHSPDMERGLTATFDFIDEHESSDVLAKVIMENYPDRVPEGRDNTTVIYRFNDHDETTREEVVAMMEKAAVLLDEKRALENKTPEDVLAEIDELLAA
jgi:hypothetical protein